MAAADYSEQTAREIDVEVRKIIDDATEEVRRILQSRRAALEAVAQRLIEKEVIDGSGAAGLPERSTTRRRSWCRDRWPSRKAARRGAGYRAGAAEGDG